MLQGDQHSNFWKKPSDYPDLLDVLFYIFRLFVDQMCNFWLHSLVFAQPRPFIDIHTQNHQITLVLELF